MRKGVLDLSRFEVNGALRWRKKAIRTQYEKSSDDHDSYEVPTKTISVVHEGLSLQRVSFPASYRTCVIFYFMSITPEHMLYEDK